MIQSTLYTMGSVIFISLVALIAAIPFFLKKEVSKKTLLVLLSVSVGALLASVFMHFIPEINEHGYHMETAIFILVGFMMLFIVEKFVHYHHSKKIEHKDHAHGHAYHLAAVNLIGDGLHNFLDGLVVAGAYVSSIPLGIAATISIVFHEVPQEIADLGVLLYSGMSKKKAIFFNLLSATTAIIGAVIGIMLSGLIEGFTHFILPFAAGNFIYIAASNLLPELHRNCHLRESFIHIGSIILGIAIMAVITIFTGHMH